MGTPALYMTKGQLVDVIDEREELSFVKFPDGRCIWVKSTLLDFDSLVDDATAAPLDDDWGPENDDTLGFDSPTDWDEYEMNPDDCFEIDSGDHYDMEYDR